MKKGKKSKEIPGPVGQATAAVESATAIQWEVEEDHLLSYFLGGGNDTTVENLATDNAAVQNDGRDENMNIEPNMVRPLSEPINNGNAMAQWPQNNGAPVGTNYPSVVNGASHPGSDNIRFYDGPRSVHGSFNSAADATMPTVAEYNSFVRASQHQRHLSSSLQNQSGSAGSMHKVPSTTSSSLSCMAAALTLGGPNHISYIQQKLQSREMPRSVTQHTFQRLNAEQNLFTFCERHCAAARGA